MSPEGVTETVSIPHAFAEVHDALISHLNCECKFGSSGNHQHVANILIQALQEQRETLLRNCSALPLPGSDAPVLHDVVKPAEVSTPPVNLSAA